MSRHHHNLLKKLCNNDSTFEKAKSILHTAAIKTTPGSGYELGQGSSGLPAICAYLAAAELGDTDLTEKNAQISSCLKPKVFQTTLNTVRSALAATSTSSNKSSRKVTYRALLDKQRLGRKAMILKWMEDTEGTLLNNREMQRKYANASDAVTLAVFCWTLKLMERDIDSVPLIDKYEVSRDQFDELVEVLHDVCSKVADQVKDDIISLRAKVATKKSKVSSAQLPAPPAPTLRALSRTPSKSALRAPSVDLSPTKTPSHKRKVAFDAIAEEEEEFDACATPTKRRKFSSPLKPSEPASLTPAMMSRISASASKSRQTAEDDSSQPVAGPSTPRRQRIFPAQPSSTHSTRSVRSSRSQSVAHGSAPSTPRRKPTLPTIQEHDAVPRRRYRPIFADQQQWLKGDSRLERELKGWQEKWQELVRNAHGDVWKVGRAAAVSAPVDVAS